MNQARRVRTRPSLLYFALRIATQLSAKAIDILLGLVAIEAEVDHFEEGLQKLARIRLLVEIKLLGVLRSVVELK